MAAASQRNEYTTALSHARADAQWYGDEEEGEEEEGEEEEEGSGVGQLDPQAAFQHATRRDYGGGIWRALLAPTISLSRLSDALEDTHKKLDALDPSSPISAAGGRAVDWQWRRGGEHRGWTPLMFTVRLGNVEAARLLLRHGASTSAPLVSLVRPLVDGPAVDLSSPAFACMCHGRTHAHTPGPM